ncbi:MAG: hypothetical protein ABTD50_13360 [Polyangiaceae bacterium]
MSEGPSAPVAVRVIRPYATEDELLEREPDTLSRTTVSLVGAPSKPQGVVLRFEVVLSTGVVLLRGEGRAIGFREDAHEGQGELTLRFTRLDTRSKAVIDRATAMREARRPPSSSSARPSLPPLEAHLTAAPVPVESAASLPAAAPSVVPASPNAPYARENSVASVPSKHEREPALARLRERGKAIDVTFVKRSGP